MMLYGFYLLIIQRKNVEEIKGINNELCRVDASANRLQDVEKDIRTEVD
jgi:division protein CdvB (Snf7/Vps24/ESCRT-III family)